MAKKKKIMEKEKNENIQNPENQKENTENLSKEQQQEVVDETEKKNCNEAVSEETKSLLEKYNELNDKYLRLIAEYDNYRKRTLKEKMDLIKSGGSDVLISILPVIDNFERALSSLNAATEIEPVKEGILLIYNSFVEFLKQRGVQEIEALNLPLNTDLHEAVAQTPAQNDETKGKIIDVIEKGYILNEKVLRFAKVIVAQ